MNVLLLNTYAYGGGAAIAAQRMLEGLIDAGVNARMLVASPITDEKDDLETVDGIQRKIAFISERIQIYRANGFDRTDLFKFSSASYGVDISEHPWVQWADIIHIHWVQQGFLSLKCLEKLFTLPHKRIFWSLHDLWPITGGCHIPFFIKEGKTHFCHQYLSQCERCPILHSKKKQDLAHRVYLRKQKWPYEKIQFLGVSRAVTGELKTYLKPFSKSLPPQTISNIINPETFYLEPHRKSTEGWRLLFIASRADDPVKGLDLLKEVLQKAASLSNEFKKNSELLIIGQLKKEMDEFPIKVIHKERINEEELRVEYNSATITLSTSRYETFGQTLLESIACGTPAMAFGVGGTSDIIQNQKNGILIKPYDTTSYAEQLLYLCQETKEMNHEMIAASIEDFKAPKIIAKLLNLYNS